MVSAHQEHPRRRRPRCACGRQLNGRTGPGGRLCLDSSPVRHCAACGWPDHESRGDWHQGEGGRLVFICDDCADVDAERAS